MFGQHIGLSATPNSIPEFPNVVATYSWNVPGERIKNFEETAGDPNATPPVPFSGHKVPLTDLSGPSVSFHWINGDFAGEQNDVTVDVTIDGKTAKAKAKFKVFRPRMDSFTGTYTSNNPTVDYIQGSIGLGDLVNSQQTHRGITWRASVETPGTSRAGGDIAFEQLLAGYNLTAQGTRGGTPYNKQKQGSNALDSLDSDPRYGDSSTFIPLGAIGSVVGDDSPSVRPEFSDNQISIDHSFKTYLVYRPLGADSIWVVLGKLDWSFAVTAHYAIPNWVIDSYSPTTPASEVTGQDEHELPEWDIRAQDIPTTDVPPTP